MIIEQIEINKELCDYIEALHYEVYSRKDLLAFAMGKGFADTDSFKQYHDEYQEFYVKYETAKDELYNMYLKEKYEGKPIRWELKFDTRILNVMEDK